MSEIFWGTGAIEVQLDFNLILAQTFTPLWSHYLERIRFEIKPSSFPSIVRVSIQYTDPEGKPSGDDLIRVERRQGPAGIMPSFELYQEVVDRIRLVEGTEYAFLMQVLHAIPLWEPFTRYVPSPSEYPRGKLIKSTDAGATWDTTDIGDLHFGEFGDPPLNPTPYNPPIVHWSVTQISQNDYLTSACIRVATTEPCKMKAHFSRDEPASLQVYKVQRGGDILCLDRYSFNSYYDFDQLEKWDSMYHTFHITNLKEGDTYWLTFTAESALEPTTSTAPLFKRHHPEAPPFTTIRRPNEAGDQRQLMGTGQWPLAQNWNYVKEATPDEWLTCVYAPLPGTRWRYDLYNIADISLFPTLPIEQVHFTGRFAKKYGYGYASGACIYIKTHGTTYISTRWSNFGDNFENKHWHLYKNPYTGEDWTQLEVSDLQIGVGLKSYEGVGWAVETWCTQLYCKIYHKCEAYY